LITKKWNELTALNKIPNVSQNQKTERINTTINCYSCICPITKLDISMQKGNSHLLSNTGLKLLKKNDPKKFEEVKRRYLPRRGVSGFHTKFEDDEINHISKQIRNEYYNTKRYLKQTPKNQLEFFSVG